MQKHHIKWDYLSLALLAFGGLGLEMLVLLIESTFYKTSSFGEWNLTESLLHWSVTCFLWGLTAWFLYNVGKKHLNYKLNLTSKPSKKAFLIIALLFIITCINSYISWGFEPKPTVEMTNMLNHYGHGGPIAFTFQYIYYAFEVILVLLLMSFAQEYGELKSHLKNIPWGGLMLGLTWGLIHILTKDFLTGIQGLILGIIFGCIYLLLKKNVRYSYLILYLMFVL